MANSANFESSIIIRAGVAGISDINHLIDTIEQAGGDVSHLRTQAEQLNNTWNSLSTEEQNRQLQELGTTTNGLARQTNTATASMERLFHARTDSTINTEIAQVNNSLNTLHQRFQSGSISQQEFNRLTQAGQARLQGLQAELNQTANNLNRTEEAAKKSNSGMNALGGGFTMLKSAIAGYLGLNLIQNLATVADSYTSMAARLKVAVGATGDLTGAMAGVQSVALQTNSSLEATTMLFTKVNDVGKQMGLTQQQSLDLTKTINQAITIGGGSAQASEAAITQLTQALQSGVLRGDEFNSIMEQAPGISKALATSLGVTTGELRKMAEEGKLSSTTVITALQKQSANIQADFDKFPKTIGQAMQAIKTQWEVVVGEFNTESGASKVVVNALKIIGDNLGLLKTLFNDMGDGVSNFMGHLGDIDPSTITTLKATLSQAYDTVKDLAKSFMDMGETAWSAFKSTLDSITPLFSAFTSGQQATSGLDTALNVLRLGMGILSDGAAELSIVLNALVGGLQFVSGGLRELESKIAGFLGFKDIAAQAEQASDRLFAAGEKSLARANEQALNFKSKTVQAYEDMHKTEEQKNAESVATNQKALAEKSKALADFVATEKDWVSERIKLDKQLQEARKNGDTETVTKLTKNLADLDTEAQNSATKRGKLEKDKAEAVQQFAEQSIAANKGVASEQLKSQLAAEGYSLAIDKAGKVTVKAMTDAKKEGINLGLSLQDAAKKAAEGLGVDVKAALNQLNPAFSRNVEEIRKVGDGYNNLKKEGLDAGNLIRASLEKLLEGAKSQKEIDTVRQMYNQFGVEGKLSATQVSAGLEAVKEKTNQLQEEITGVKNAYKELGLQTQAELNKTAQDNKRAYDTINNDATASAAIKQQAFEKTVQAAIAADDKTIISNLKSQAVARGYGDIVEENGKKVFKTAEEVKAIHDKEAQEAEERKKVRIEQAHEQVEAIKKAEEEEANAIAESTAKQKASLDSMEAFMDGVTNSMKAKFTAVGLTADEASQAFNKMNLSMNGMGKQWADFGSWITDMNTLNQAVEREADAFAQVKTSAESATSALSNADATSQDLANAQNVLYQATNANVQGIKRMDSQTLRNLQNAIDSTKQKMQSLSQTALQTEQDIEASLASARGDDTTAMKLEQTRKLADLQDKLAQAEKRSNIEEIEHYKRAIDLQNQLNATQTAQAQQQAQEKAQQSQAQAQPVTPTVTPPVVPVTPTPTATPTQSPIYPNSANVSDSIHANAIMLADQIASIKQEAISEFMQILNDELKRRAK